MTTKYTTEEVKQLYSIAVDQGRDALESNEKIAVGRYCRKHGINRPGLEPQTAPSPLPEQATETPAPQPAEETQSTQTQTETGVEPITGEQYFKHLGLGPAESVETEISKLETPQTGDATASDTDLELLRSVRFIERWPDDIVTTPAQREIRRLPAQGLIPGGNRARPPPQGLLRRHRAISGSRTMNGNDNNGQPLDIIVQGTPITKGSVQPWRTKHGKAVSVDARLQSWEAAIRGTAVSMMTASGLKPYDCPISITGEIRVPRTDKLHDLPAWQTAKTSGGGDLDKLQRAIGDALQTTNSRYPGRNREGVISNDSRIIHWQISKRYADETRPEGVYLTIRPISTPELPDWQPATPAGRTIHDNLQRRSQRLADMLRQHPHDRKDTTK